jgi:hypothetical protein
VTDSTPLVRFRSHARSQRQQLCCGCLDQQLHGWSRPTGNCFLITHASTQVPNQTLRSRGALSRGLSSRSSGWYSQISYTSPTEYLSRGELDCYGKIASQPAGRGLEVSRHCLGGVSTSNAAVGGSTKFPSRDRDKSDRRSHVRAQGQQSSRATRQVNRHKPEKRIRG